MIGSAYDITDPRMLTCEYCDQLAAGRVMVELHGGSLMVCLACYELLKASRAKPYSKVMERFSIKACGYNVSAKFARITSARR